MPAARQVQRGKLKFRQNQRRGSMKPKNPKVKPSAEKLPHEYPPGSQGALAIHDDAWYTEGLTYAWVAPGLRRRRTGPEDLPSLAEPSSKTAASSQSDAPTPSPHIRPPCGLRGTASTRKR